MNLAAKYRPTEFEDMTEQSLIVDIFKNVCNKDPLEIRNFLLTGPSGTGKANTMDTDILTPTGYVKMKNIRIGTTVFTADGNHAHVIGIYPQGEKSIYRITLCDDTFIDVSDEHLNCVWTLNADGSRTNYVLTTEQLISQYTEGTTELRVDNPIVDWEYTYINHDPYDLGLSIGNICSNCDTDNVSTLHTLGIGTDISDVHIPKAYLHNSREIRIQVLKGLLDSELAHKDSSNEGSYVIKNLPVKVLTRISRNIEFLVRSLGFEDVVIADSDEFHTHKIRHFKEQYFNVHNCKVSNKLYRTIKSIECLGKKPCQCIMLDHEDHTYICNIGLIPTHNTTIARIMANKLNNGVGSPIELDAASHNSVDDVRSIIDQAHQYPIIKDMKYKCFIIDECLTGDVEVLTDKGFVRFDELTDDCIVAQYHSDNTISYVKPTEIIRNYYTGEMYKWSPDGKNYINMTPNHVQIFSDGNGNIYEQYIKDWNFTGAKFKSLITVVEKYDKSGYNFPVSVIDSKTANMTSYGYSGIIYCVKVPSHKIIVKVGDFAFVTGNCHSISPQGWQAFLKTIEETPAMSVFFFCTTNPEKVPETILSRVPMFKLSKISTDGISKRLKYILEQENASGKSYTYDEDAIEYISKYCKGGMRNAITSLDKVLAYSSHVDIAATTAALELPNYDDYFILLNSIAKKDNKQTIETIHKVYNSGANFIKWMEEFHGFISQIIIYIFTKDISNTMIPPHYKDKIENYGTAHANICLRLANKLVVLNQELRTTQYLEELTVTALCTEVKKS